MPAERCTLGRRAPRRTTRRLVWRSPLRGEPGVELTVHGRPHRGSRIRARAIPGNWGSAWRERAIPGSHRAGRVCRLMRCAGRWAVRGRTSCRELFRAGPMCAGRCTARRSVLSQPRPGAFGSTLMRTGCSIGGGTAHWEGGRTPYPCSRGCSPAWSRGGRGVLRLLCGSESGVVRHAEAPALCCAATTQRFEQRGERASGCAGRVAAARPGHA